MSASQLMLPVVGAHHFEREEHQIKELRPTIGPQKPTSLQLIGHILEVTFFTVFWGHGEM